MRLVLLTFALALALSPPVSAVGLGDAAGVIRVFGDQASWMSAAFVVGDGSWVVTTWEATVERTGPESEQTIRYPLYISPYTGRAYQCELRASNKDLGIALLKLPIAGLPAAPLAQLSDFSKAAYATLGQLVSGEPLGSRWPTEVYGITREKVGESHKLAVSEWDAKKAFITDIGKYKWVFLSELVPDRAVPNGSIIARSSNVVGMYLNKLTITGGKENVVYGRCAMATEMARYLGDRGIDTATLYDPPQPTVKAEPGADAAFQLQARIYSHIGARRPAFALNAATALIKLRPADAQAQMALGLALSASDKHEDALKAFDEAVKLDPKLPTLRANRALALIGLKRTKEAESELLKAAEEAPMDVRPITALADFYLADEKALDKAITYAKKATTMASSSPAAYLLLARVEKRRKNYKEATVAIGEALKLAPDWGEAWYALGATCEEAGDKDSAEKAYRKLIEKQPQNPDFLLTLASFLVDQGKKDEPLELIGKVKELKPPKEVLDAAQALEDKITGKKSTEEQRVPTPPSTPDT